MTTFTHVIKGLHLEGLHATVLSVAIILATGYALGQLLRGLSSRGRHGDKKSSS